jgi:hypothetical protein
LCSCAAARTPNYLADSAGHQQFELVARALECVSKASLGAVIVPENQRSEKQHFFQWKRLYIKSSTLSDSRVIDAVKRVEAGRGQGRSVRAMRLKFLISA